MSAVLALLCQSVQRRLRRIFERRTAAIWAAPFLLTGIVSLAAVWAGAWSPTLAFAVLAYTAAPVLSAWVAGAGPAARPAFWDFLTILLIWLPLEFAAGARLVPRPAQGFLHSVAYGVAILLGLLLFLAFRPFPGLKYNLPRSLRDGWLPLAGFAASAPILIAVGVAIGFIPPPHWPTQPLGTTLPAAGIIFAGTALPEEILFRSLIQNLLMQRFGANWRTLLAASLIFGAAHLDNGPQPVPNWRYFILATIAGLAYGAVFHRASTVLSSAALHMLVDWTKHYYF